MTIFDIQNMNLEKKYQKHDNRKHLQNKKHENLDKALDKIRQKYGDDAIVRGSVMQTDIGIYSGKSTK